MTMALSLDPSGNLVIPADVIESAHLSKEAPLEVTVTPDGLVIRSTAEYPEARIVRNEFGESVIETDFPISDEDVIRAIAADRR